MYSFSKQYARLGPNGSQLEAPLRRVAADMPRLLKLLRYSPRSMPAATRLIARTSQPSSSLRQSPSGDKASGCRPAALAFANNALFAVQGDG